MYGESEDFSATFPEGEGIGSWADGGCQMEAWKQKNKEDAKGSKYGGINDSILTAS